VIAFLVHKDGDDVGIAVIDLKKGMTARGKTLTGNREYSLTVLEDIPFGHKIALKNLQKGDKVVEYGEIIGVATQDIPKGAHVHIHNLRSLRWGGE